MTGRFSYWTTRLSAVTCAACALSQVGCKWGTNLGLAPKPRTQESSSQAETTDVVNIPLADPSCLETEGSRSLGTQGVWTFNNNAITSTKESLSYAVADGAEGLRGRAVGATIIGHTELETKQCMEPGPGVVPECRTESQRVVTAGQPLKLCKKDFSYPRSSVESAALASFTAIEKSAEVFAAAFSSSKRPTPVWTLVLPTLDTEYIATRFSGEKVKATRHRSDNAFWGIAQGKTSSGSEINVGIISILPPSKVFQERSRPATKGLWELPFVLAHEYGHHAFFSKVPGVELLVNQSESLKFSLSMNGANLRTSVVSDDESTFEREFSRSNFSSPLNHVRRILSFATSTPSRVVRVYDAVQAVNEGFADVFGEMVYPSGSKSMSILSGVCRNREIALTEFESKRQLSKKTLDTWQLGLFLSTSIQEPDEADENGCLPPSYQDTHTIGAIIAHGIDSIIASGTNISRGAVLESWLTRMDANWSNLTQLSPGDFLDNAVWSFVTTAAEASPGGKLNAAQCSAVARVFPAYSNSHFAELSGLGCAPSAEVPTP